MGLTVVHAKFDGLPDDPTAAAAGYVLPSDWNANHTITGTVGLADVDQTAAYAFTGLGATTLAANKVLTLTTGGSATSPGVALGASNYGIYSDGANLVALTIGGVRRVYVTSTELVLGGSNGLDLAGGGPFLSYGGSQNPAAYQFGKPNAAVPIPAIIQGQGSRAGTDSNVGGAKLTVAPGAGTGTGSPATLNLQSPTKAASSATAQTQNDTLIMDQGVPRLPGQLFASLPASPTAGMWAYVTDSTTATIGAVVTGGGANPVIAVYLGANWKVWTS